MGISSIWKKVKGMDDRAKRSAVITAPMDRVFEAVAKQMADGSTGLDAESGEKIKGMLGGMAGMGGVNVDEILAKVRMHVDLSGKPNRIVSYTAIDKKKMGPSINVTLETIEGGHTRVRVAADLEAKGMSERLMMAAMGNKLRDNFNDSVDPILQKAAEELKATITFEENKKS
jgi:hypothetical protein